MSKSSFPVVKQDGSRDCGAACVRAVLQWWYAPHVPPASTLDDAPAAVAAWTVELLAALRQCHVDCALYTTSAVGVSEGHGAMPWYAGESLVADSERVPELFRAARRAGWEIHERSLTLADIARLLAREGTIGIFLVCSNTLNGLCLDPGSFKGHYIVVLGCDMAGGAVAYMDPTCDDLQSVPAEVFDAARRAQGTDEDVLVCTRFQ